MKKVILNLHLQWTANCFYVFKSTLHQLVWIHLHLFKDSYPSYSCQWYIIKTYKLPNLNVQNNLLFQIAKLSKLYFKIKILNFNSAENSTIQCCNEALKSSIFRDFCPSFSMTQFQMSKILSWRFWRFFENISFFEKKF